MAIKVTKNEVDVETEIMQKLSEMGISIDFNPDDEKMDDKESKSNEEKNEEGK